MPARCSATAAARPPMPAPTTIAERVRRSDIHRHFVGERIQLGVVLGGQHVDVADRYAGLSSARSINVKT